MEAKTVSREDFHIESTEFVNTEKTRLTNWIVSGHGKTLLKEI